MFTVQLRFSAFVRKIYYLPTWYVGSSQAAQLAEPRRLSGRLTATACVRRRRMRVCAAARQRSPSRPKHSSKQLQARASPASGLHYILSIVR